MKKEAEVMTSFELEVKQEFLVEALMNLSQVQALFDNFDSSADSKAWLDKMFFVAHNLKGGSLSVGFNEIAGITNHLETLILKIKNDEIQLSPQILKTIMRSNDRLVEMLHVLQNDFGAHFDNQKYLTEIQSCYVKTSKIAN